MDCCFGNKNGGQWASPEPIIIQCKFSYLWIVGSWAFCHKKTWPKELLIYFSYKNVIPHGLNKHFMNLEVWNHSNYKSVLGCEMFGGQCDLFVQQRQYLEGLFWTQCTNKHFWSLSEHVMKYMLLKRHGWTVFVVQNKVSLFLSLDITDRNDQCCQTLRLKGLQSFYSPCFWDLQDFCQGKLNVVGSFLSQHWKITFK